VLVDQHGYGYQYPCSDPEHGHRLPSAQTEAELDFMRALRWALPPWVVIYSEAVPGDVASQWQDGACVEAVTSFRKDPRALPLSISRFGLPAFKSFELLTQGEPLGGDVEGLRLAFFNGEGIRRMGDLSAGWFSAAALAELRRQRQILDSWGGFFLSPEPVPLVETEAPGLYAHLYPTNEGRLWTLWSPGSANSGPALSLLADPESSWTDCSTGASGPSTALSVPPERLSAQECSGWRAEGSLDAPPPLSSGSPAPARCPDRRRCTSSPHHSASAGS
jgi:hypothetical protein